ncbi:GTP 3',8-cyclase MoaA [Rheinheimera soli]|uniref:Cyclic pyranopterin phosphate synthase n=1 Tax=Rheinheimera soli TaxID=443616 RepID=A0ABU1W343_9GAMM|nr:GTP 3',8-cyclase MoaA [Rheinheimera soli]MDR7122347.1 cyclic pyranopterin phosphate synthase [Rheinheimera soli]
MQHNPLSTSASNNKALTDSFGRSFGYLRLSVTDQCNFRCLYCLPDGSSCVAKTDLSLQEIKQLVTTFAELGTSKVRITGGEPSLRKDLTSIISTVKAIPGIQTVALSTNGYRLQKDVRHWREAGLDQLTVSVDSLDEATFALVTGQDKLPQIMAGLELADSLGFDSIKLNTVLLKQHNAAALADFQALVRQKNWTLRFIELMQTQTGSAFFRQQHLSAQALEQQLQQQGWTVLTKTATAGPAREYQHPDYQGRLGFITPYQQDFCDSCNRLRVSSTGLLFLCLFAEQHQNLRPWLNQPTELLKGWLQQQVQQKKASHFLHQQNPGATRNFAMIGG